MSRCSHLYGDQALLNQYNELLDERLSAKPSAAVYKSNETVDFIRGIEQMMHDIQIYDPNNSYLDPYCGSGAQFHAKKEFYRLISLLLSDLGLIFGIRSPSPWQVISELHTRGIIGESEVAKIRVCLSIANEIRLKTYFANNGQKELLSPVPRYAYTAEQCSIEAPFYNCDQDVAVRLLSTSFDMRQRCHEFCVKYHKMKEIDIGILKSPSLQVSKEYLRGQLYCRLQNFPKALEWMKFVSKDSPDYSSSLNAQGVIHHFCGEYEKSVECLEKALEVHCQNEEISNLNVLIAINNLAAALLCVEQYEKAKIRLEEGISKHNAIYGQGSHTVILCSLMRHLGLVHGKLGDKKLAIEVFQNVEQMQNTLKFVPDMEIITQNLTMALLFSELDQYSQSLEYAKRALQLGSKVFGKDNLSHELAEIYSDVAVVYENCNMNDDALSWYERSLELFQLVFGDNFQIGGINCLNQLGKLYSQRRETNRAVEYLQSALKQARVFTHGKPHLGLARILTNFGEVLKRAEKFEESRRYFQEANDMMDKIFGPNHAHSLTMRILCNLGEIHEGLDLAKAFQHYKDALKMNTVIYGENNANEEVAQIYTNIAFVAEMMGNLNEAKECFIKAAETYRKVSFTKDKCPSVVANLYSLSSNCEARGEQDEALKCLEEAREVATVVGCRHGIVANVVFTLGRKYREMGSLAKSEMYIQEAIEIAKNVPEDNSGLPPDMLELVELLKNINK